MADIQPKNTNTIRTDVIKEKTGSAGVLINGSVKISAAGAIIPQTATIDAGSTSAPFQNVFSKTLISDGQTLSVGTTSANDVDFQTDALTRMVLGSDGKLTMDPTNGGGISLTAPLTGVSQPITANVTAAGSDNTDATPLTSVWNRVTTALSGQGVAVWNMDIGQTIYVWNTSGVSINIWGPNGTTVFNAKSAGASLNPATNILLIITKRASNAYDAASISASVAS